MTKNKGLKQKYYDDEPKNEGNDQMFVDGHSVAL